MRISVLIENTAASDKLVAEHSLSLLLETQSARILFDAGASSVFAENAKAMGIDLSHVDFAVLSHGHYDHGGGLPHFLELNDHAPVWVSPHAFDAHFNAVGKDISLPQELKSSGRICTPSAAVQELAPGITLYQAACVPSPYPAAGAGMSAIIDGRLVADDFRHEQYLLIEKHGKRILISGCSHRGILNIASHFKPDVLIGGFHFMKADSEADAPMLMQAAELLSTLPTRYYTGHCTGAAATELLGGRMGCQLDTISTGLIFDV